MMQVIHEATIVRNGKEIMIAEEIPMGLFEFKKPRFVCYIPHSGPERIVEKTGDKKAIAERVNRALDELTNLPPFPYKGF